MDLDLSFLQARLDSSPPRRGVNVFEILREAWRETRVDMTLQFFLDPGERHGLGPLVIDALLRSLDGAPIVGAHGLTDERFVAEGNFGSTDWQIDTQVDYIDVLALNRELGLAIVLENKIGHELNNPLRKYARRASAEDGISSVLVAVLAPQRRTARPDQALWLSRSITYAELAAEIKRAPELVDFLLAPSGADQRRSLDLLQQFIEARSGGPGVGDMADEAAKLEAWRGILSEHEEAINEFFRAREAVGRILRDRNKRLAPLIEERLDAAGLETGWEAHGGRRDEVWNAYHFPAVDWSIELKLSSSPSRPDMFTYDYPGRTYKHSRIEPLGVAWTVGDDVVAEAFVARVVEIVSGLDPVG